MRFCGGRNIPLCEGLAACRETPASRVLCCRGTGRTASAAFVRDVVWPAGILGGVLRGRRRCLANSSAWPDGSFGERPTSAVVPARSAWSPRVGPKLAGVRQAAGPTIGRMPSYEPVDLSAACNAGVDVLGDEPGDVPLGRVDLRGLPFLIGSEPPSAERCFLQPGSPTSVKVGRLARRVIVAHRLLEPGAPAGHAVGQPVAEYAFHLAGGVAVTALIRERFEIQVVPPVWGRLPFLAVTDTSDDNLPRFAGSWGEAGARLVEHDQRMDPPGTTCGAGTILTRNERSNGSSSSRAALGSSSPASRPATLMSTRSSARRRARCGW